MADSQRLGPTEITEPTGGSAGLVALRLFPFTKDCSWIRLALVISCMLAVVAPASTVIAADHLDKLEHEATFHIAAGSLETALIQFSAQTEIQIVVSVPVANISVAAVEGRRNAREVLTALLNASGLTYSIVGETVTIRASSSAHRQ